MALEHAIVTVGTSATALNSPELDSTGLSLLVQCPGSEPVYLGGQDVTTASYGHVLAQGGTVSVDVPPGEVLYAVAAAETTANVLASGVTS